jgi:glycosyltransferase involved in cell wall biosynthesis
VELGRAIEAEGLSVEFEPIVVDERFAELPAWVSKRITRTPTAPLTIQIAVPHTPPHPGRRTVAFTMWETSEINELGVRALNACELVVTPSTSCFVDFIKCGVLTPISVVPLGIDPGEWRPRPWRPDDGLTVFGAAGRMAHGGSRKGLNELAHAFTLAFPEHRRDVRLELKVWPDDVRRMQLPPDPRIVVRSEPWPVAMLAGWLARLDAYVCPSKGEGWGLLTHQAMAVGRPVLACYASGTAEFWRPTMGWPISFGWAQAGGLYRGQGRWLVPYVPSMVKALRQCYRAGRSERQRRGDMAAARAAEFTWARTGREMVAVLRKEGLIPDIPLRALPCRVSPAVSVPVPASGEPTERGTVPSTLGA